MEVLFTHGYYIEEDPKEQEIMRPYPPLGILYLSAWLEKHGVDNEVYDTTFSNKKAHKAFLVKNKPGILAIYTNLMTKVNVIELVKYIRAEPDLNETFIVIGGPDVTYNIENYLGSGANVIVFGEGEQTMLEIVNSVKNGVRSALFHIPGVAFFDEGGDVVKTEARKRIRPVDGLPIPNRKKIDLNKYLEVWKTHHGKSTVSISTQRGCPYTCRWCSTAVYGQSYRRRSPEVVVSEMKYLKENYNPDSLWFVDDVFTVSHKWLKTFRDALEKANINIPFECITRADRLDPEVISVLKASGCFRVWIGAESGSQKIIDAMDRRVDVNHVRNMIIEARQQGLEAGTFIMLGYPGETETDIYETVNHLKISNPDLFTITVAYPIKGTGLYEEIEAQRLNNLDWQTSTDRQIDFKRTYPRKYYDYAVRWVVNSVNYNKQKLNGRQLTPHALKMLAKSSLARAGMIFHRQFGKG
ncbi:MAG: radical SAM protein [Bacteroidota bacterium]